MNITLTGATGFLGAYIARELVERGHKVRALRRTGGETPFYIDSSVWEKVEWVEGDILHLPLLEEAMQGADAVVHAAAMVSFGKGDKDLLYQVNRDGTANVVNLALEMGIPRLVHVSSVAALGRTAHGDKVDEEKKWVESPLNTHYARSKQQAEMEVWRGMAEGLSAVIVNPSTILGYGDWKKSSCAIFKKVHDGFPWYTDGINGFVDVEDVARATVLLMESEITEQRYILSGENWSFKKLFETMARGFGVKPPTRLATPFLSAMAWRMEKIRCLFNGEKPVLTRESSRIAQSKTYFQNEKLLQALPGFQFTPLEESVLKACAKYGHHY